MFTRDIERAEPRHPLNSKCIVTFLMTVVAIGMSGCQGSPVAPISTPSIATSTANVTPPTESANSEPQGAKQTAPIDDDSPFSRYISVIHSYTAEPAATNDPSATTEPFVAQCMKKRGFTYTPQILGANPPFSGFFEDGDPLSLQYLPATRDDAVKSGYGTMAPESLDPVTSPSEQSNSDYRESLSPRAQQQYDLALLGYLSPYDPPDPSIPTGCRQLAAEKYDNQPPKKPTIKDIFREQYADLYLAMNDLVSTDLLEDSKMRTLNQEWNACMLAKGYDLTPGNQYNKDNVGPWAAYTMALRTLPNGKLGDKWYHYQFEQDTPPEQRSLSGSPAEIKIAIDDYDCQDSTDYVSRHKTIQIQMEQSFVDKHRTQLDAMLAFAEEHPLS